MRIGEGRLGGPYLKARLAISLFLLLVYVAFPSHHYSNEHSCAKKRAELNTVLRGIEFFLWEPLLCDLC